MAREENYSNREIDAMFHGVHEKLDAILSQTSKTNGAVAKLKLWQSRTIGAITVIIVLVVPLTVYSFNIITKCGEACL